jgi:hypothetical protein
MLMRLRRMGGGALDSAEDPPRQPARPDPRLMCDIPQLICSGRAVKCHVLSQAGMIKGDRSVSSSAPLKITI